jgi:hypothetical protein
MRDYPSRPFVRVEQAEAVVGAAELERPAALEWFGLQADGAAASRVERPGGQQRGTVDDPGKPGSGGLNPVKCEGLLAGRRGDGSSFRSALANVCLLCKR